MKNNIEPVECPSRMDFKTAMMEKKPEGDPNIDFDSIRHTKGNYSVRIEGSIRDKSHMARR